MFRLCALFFLALASVAITQMAGQARPDASIAPDPKIADINTQLARMFASTPARVTFYSTFQNEGRWLWLDGSIPDASARPPNLSAENFPITLGIFDNATAAQGAMQTELRSVSSPKPVAKTGYDEAYALPAGGRLLARQGNVVVEMHFDFVAGFAALANILRTDPTLLPNLVRQALAAHHFGDPRPVHAVLSGLAAKVPELAKAKLSASYPDAGGSNAVTAIYADTDGGWKIGIIARVYDSEAAAKSEETKLLKTIPVSPDKTETIQGVKIIEFTRYGGGTYYFQAGSGGFQLNVEASGAEPLLKKIATALIAAVITPAEPEPAAPRITQQAAPPELKVAAQPAPGGTAERALGYFGDGTAVAVFRERAVDGVQDVHFANWEDGRWSESRVLVPEGWKPASTPTAPPSADARDGRAVAAWFTAADNDPRVQLSFSSDAGHVWQIPLRLSEGKQPGQAVAAVLLRDGAALALWQEGARVLLRRVSPLNDLGPVAQVAESRAPIESPSLVVLADRDENAPVRVALSYRSTGKSATTVLTLPSLADLTKGDSPCACGQATAQLRRGFELHGAVLSVNASAGTAVVKHEAIPGVMPAMTMQFRADATTLAALVPGQELLGRMEDRNAEWWLFDVRLLGPTVPEKR